MNEKAWLNSTSACDIIAWRWPRKDGPAAGCPPVRFFCCAAARLVFPMLRSQAARDAVAFAEKMAAEGDVDSHERSRVIDAVRFADSSAAAVGKIALAILPFPRPDEYTVDALAKSVLLCKEEWEKGGWPGPFPADRGCLYWPAGHSILAHVARDVSGNPFREGTGCNSCRGSGRLVDGRIGSPTRAARVWCPGCVGAWAEARPELPAVAQEAYQSLTPAGHLDAGLLAIAADLAQEAGCESVEMLNSLRGGRRCAECPDLMP